MKILFIVTAAILCFGAACAQSTTPSMVSTPNSPDICDASLPRQPCRAMPPGEVQGKVISSAGSPIAGFQVRVVLQALSFEPVIRVEQRATTDSRGDYAIRDLPRGDYAVTLTPPSGSKYLGGDSGVPVLAGKEGTRIDWIVSTQHSALAFWLDWPPIGPCCAAVDGYMEVVGRGGSSPVGLRDVKVWVQTPRGKLVRGTSTDKSGHYRMDALAPDIYLVAFRPSARLQDGFTEIRTDFSNAAIGGRWDSVNCLFREVGVPRCNNIDSQELDPIRGPRSLGDAYPLTLLPPLIQTSP